MAESGGWSTIESDEVRYLQVFGLLLQSST
jgi:hypothetical protein